MARVPDIVSDSELKTNFVPDYTKVTVHSYNEPDRVSGHRHVVRTEHWHRRNRIGTGGYGDVWLQECIKGGKSGSSVRAVKQIRTSGKFEISHYLRELEAIAKFSHPKYERHFVKSLGWYNDSGNLFIAMEYLELGDIFAYTKNRPPLPEDEVNEIIHQTLEALQMMHDNEFAHRDLKLGNILIQSHPPKKWWVKLSDFGISKRVEVASISHRSITHQGTPGYMAPELWRIIKKGSPYATDMWAIGAIAFRLLTKQSPFDFCYLVDWAKGDCSFPTEFLWDTHVSEPGINFIIQNMQIQPDKRLSIDKALSHEWFECLTGGTQAPNPTWDESPSGSSNIGPSREENSTLAMGGLIHSLSSIPMEDSSTSNRDNHSTLMGDSLASLSSTPRTEPLIYSRDSQQEVTVEGSSNMGFRLWGTIGFNRGNPCAMSFSLNGKVAFSTDKSYVALWDVERGSEIRLDLKPSLLLAGRSPFQTIALSPDGGLIATGNESGVISVRSTSTGTILKEVHITKPPRGVIDCAFFLNGLAAAFLLPRGIIALFFSIGAQPFVKTQVRYLGASRQYDEYDPYHPLNNAGSDNLRVLKSFHGDKDQLVYASGNIFGIHSDVSHRGQHTNFAHLFSRTEVSVVHVSSDGEYVTYYDPEKKAIYVYRAQEKRLIREISLASVKRASRIQVNGIAVSSKTKVMAAIVDYVTPMGLTRVRNHHIILWSLETGQEISKIGSKGFDVKIRPTLPMEFSPDGTYLVCGYSDEMIRVWKSDQTKNPTFFDKVRQSISRS